MDRKRVAILGATGSIGTQTVDVCIQHIDDFEVVGMLANTRKTELLALANKCGCNLAKLAGEFDIINFIDECEPDIVVNAIVGSAGLKCSYYVLSSLPNTRLAIANKESLVMAGDLLMPFAKAPGKLMPIDSEHGAIYQCLVGEDIAEVKKLWITASGGSFRGKTLNDLESVRAQDALKHPTWDMGAKITIDSATLMNKGLEVIEAHHLFGMPYSKIDVVVHPQSVIHSAVEFIDGSIKAHMGKTDMRIPIQYSLTYPKRFDAPAEEFDFKHLQNLTFESANTEVFKCLKLAYMAGEIGSSATCAINGANEVMNKAFREGRCGFLDIQNCTQACLEQKFAASEMATLEDVLRIDEMSKNFARTYLESL